MNIKAANDRSLLWPAIKSHIDTFFLVLGIGLICAVVGGGVFYLDFGEWGAMIFGGLLLLHRFQSHIEACAPWRVRQTPTLPL